MSSLNALLVAVDAGPRETLLPLAKHLGLEITSDGDWPQRVRSQQPRLVVVGTSDSARGRAIEGAARRAAGAAAVPIVAIEDFPGNYAYVEGGEAQLVIVESEPAREIHLRRSGLRGPPAEVFPLCRYDPYRARLTQLRQDTGRSWAAADAPRVLWAGQPETADSVATLAALAPLLREQRVELLFKAHPRDPGYAEGRYHVLLENAGVPFLDVTAASVHEALSLAPRLVVTQFSSVAIEAGFYGIPALWVLLPGAGLARLQEKKGCGTPPPCAAGAAAAAFSDATLQVEFGRALHDDACRTRLMRCFDAYFEVHTEAAPKTAARLRTLAL